MKHNFRVTVLIAAVASMLTAGRAQAALKLKLEASSYNPDTGTWTDTSGNNNHATQGTAANRPSLAGNQTPNGSAAVSFDGINDSLNLTAAITTSAANGYTIFAYVRPREGLDGTIVSGDLDSLQYRVSGGKQTLVKTFRIGLGPGDTVLSTVDCSSINAKVNNGGGTYRLNGAADGTASGNTFSPGITAVGRNDRSDGEWFNGAIAEIRVYDEQLSSSEIEAVEAELTLAYKSTREFLSLPIIDNPTFDDNARLFVTSPGGVGGSNPTDITGWTWTPGGGGYGINKGSLGSSLYRNNGTIAGHGHVVYIQDAGALSQTVSGWEVGKSYRLTFDYNARGGYDNPGVTATIGSDSFTDADIPPVGGSFAYYVANILHTAASASETLTITSLDNAGDDSLLFDNIQVFRAGPSIADNGFENPVQPVNDYELANGGGGGDLTGSAWTITGVAGISRNRSANHNTMYASEGRQLGMLKAVGSFVQTVSGFKVGYEYSLSLLTMKRTNGGIGGNDLEVVLDAGLSSEIVLVDINEVTYDAFKEVTESFTATRNSYTLTIRGSNPLGGDRTTFVDNVWINQLTRKLGSVIILF